MKIFPNIKKGLIYSPGKTCWVSICLDEKFSESHSVLNLNMLYHSFWSKAVLFFTYGVSFWIYITDRSKETKVTLKRSCFLKIEWCVMKPCFFYETTHISFPLYSIKEMSIAAPIIIIIKTLWRSTAFNLFHYQKYTQMVPYKQRGKTCYNSGIYLNSNNWLVLFKPKKIGFA